ncbi:hypothetical protein GQ55_2G436400 [Panicum hallii var. hallii]|uniref:Uncharacterized protein n=1 Tax=Panicum hallii var. hallii TaxID=1504633 RepID=A0A2T7EYP1_9POAL|nr:hypothetical protein GQ55_2G436400 [Panicum hallii var. hallii]
MGGSVPGRQYIHRDREAGHWRLYQDYFSEAPTYDASIFRRRCLTTKTWASLPISWASSSLSWLLPTTS